MAFWRFKLASSSLPAAAHSSQSGPNRASAIEAGIGVSFTAILAARATNPPDYRRNEGPVCWFHGSRLQFYSEQIDGMVRGRLTPRGSPRRRS